MYPTYLPATTSQLIPIAARANTGLLNAPAPDRVFVHSSGPRTSDERSLSNARMFATTVQGGLALLAAAGYGSGYAGAWSECIVLPGHVETIAAADAWSNAVAGTRIVGWGFGRHRPRIKWGAATTTILLNDVNTSIHNMILDWAGDLDLTAALSVAAPITASVAGCGIYDCYVTAGIDSDQLCTIGLAITGDDFDLVRTRIYGATAAECTTLVNISTCNRTRIEDCVIEAATSSTTVGVVRLATTAPLNILFKNSTFKNRKAASVHAVTGVAATTGTVTDCNFGVLADGTTLPWGTSNGLVDFYRCHIVNQAGETGMIPTLQST